MKRLSLNLFFFLSACFVANAQTIPYQQYGVEDGLGNSIVYSAFQDSKGYMWFCTDHGLSKFDGLHFTNYTTVDGLPTNYIMAVTETTDGTLWVATYGKGVCKFKNGMFTELHFDKADDPTVAINIIADKQGRVWISQGLGQKYVWYIEKDHYEKFSINTYKKDTATYLINNISLKSDGTILFATNKGLLGFKGNKLTWLLNENSAIYQVDEDKLGNLWMGSSGKIIEITRDNEVKNITNEFIKERENRVVKLDYEGRLWVSDYPNHLFVIDVNSNKLLYQTNVPINCFYLDDENDMWATTFGQGIFCFNYPDIINYTVKDGLASNIVTGVAEDSKGKIWIATLRGLNYIEANESGTPIAMPFLEGNEIFGFVIDNKDDLLYELNGKLEIKKKNVSKEIILNDRIVYSYKAPSGKIWLAMSEGIACYNNDSVYTPKELAFLKGKKNLAIMEDSKSNLWIGTNDGVYCYNGHTINEYTTKDGLANNTVNAIWEDATKRMWFATNEGISMLENGKWVKDSLLKGISNFMCTSFVEDHNGNMWIGTNNGLFVYGSGRIRKFDNHTGLAGVEVQSLYIDSKNYLWVGTIKGLSRINLNTYSHLIGSYPPLVYIQNIKINNSTADIHSDTSLSLRYSDNNIRISYTGLYFKNPSSLSYEYKLSGASSDNWTKTLNTSVEFSSLSPGKYQFWVRAVSSDGIYSMAPAHFSFAVLPPFWLRIWFRIIELLLLIIFTSVVIRWRISIYKRKAAEVLQRQKLEMEKQRIEEALVNAQNKLTEYTKSMVEKNELLEQFKIDIDKLRNLKSKELDEIRIEQVEHLNKTTILTEEDWNKFKDLFEHVYKGFFIRLKERLPDLTQAEIRLLCLTRLKMDTKQMASVLGISSHAVMVTRWRLKKKMGLTEGDSIDTIAESI